MADTMFVDDSTKDIAKDMEEVFNKGGMKAVIEKVKHIEGGRKPVSFNVGVIGKSGAGKSSFINDYRNLEDDDENAAPVGVTQTTMKAEPYPDPNNPNIIVYDVPGVGTEEFPRSKYLKDPRVGIDKYDFVIIITSTRLTEDDIWLYEEMIRLQKTALLVRTKVMQDVRNEMKRKKTHKDKTEGHIIKEVIDQYKFEIRLNTKVYYIDSHERKHPHLDFGDLLNDIAFFMSITKADAVLYSLKVFTSKSIKEKARHLKDRIWNISILSGARAIIPIPGMYGKMDVSLVIDEVKWYREQLGLDGHKLYGLKVKRAVKASIYAIIDTWKTISPDRIASLITPEAEESTAKLLIPIIGPILSARSSYGATKYVLQAILDKMTQDAIKLNQLIIDSHLSCHY